MFILNLFVEKLFCCKIGLIIYKTLFEWRVILRLPFILFTSFKVKFAKSFEHFYLKWVVLICVVTSLRKFIIICHDVALNTFWGDLIEICVVRLYKGHIVSDEISIEVKLWWKFWCYFDVYHICKIETFPYFGSQKHTYSWCLSIILDNLIKVGVERDKKVGTARVNIEYYWKSLIICIETVGRSV